MLCVAVWRTLRPCVIIASCFTGNSSANLGHPGKKKRYFRATQLENGVTAANDGVAALYPLVEIAEEVHRVASIEFGQVT